MELCYYLLQYQKEAAFVLAAVHMDIVEVNVALLRFTSYASPEMLNHISNSGKGGNDLKKF